MKYTRQPTTIATQIRQLQSRGMNGESALIERWLKTVGYYRLSAYWLPWETPAPPGKTRSKKFRPNTNFDDIVDIYMFDRKLRLMVMEAVDRIEIALRARWTNRVALANGSHAHLDPNVLSCGYEHAKMKANLANRAKSSSEVFIEHYRTKYSDPFIPPLWAVTELMTLGELSMWYSKTADLKIKDLVAHDLGFPNKETFGGSIQLLAYVRNICAHHGRLWNRKTVKRAPKVKKFQPDMVIKRSGKQLQPDNSMYNILVVLAHMLIHQSNDTTWPFRVVELVSTRSTIQTRAMGFPKAWRSLPVWSRAIKEHSGLIGRIKLLLPRRFR